MDNEQLAGIARQQLLMRMSDKPGQWNDPMAPLKALMKAQRDALAGDDGGFSAMTAPF
jgi:hypothetical protein